MLVIGGLLDYYCCKNKYGFETQLAQQGMFW